MDTHIRKILIVGGGTSGWLSAAYLQRALGATVEITLVESKRIGRVGVGEATIPTLRATMDFLGYPDELWMPRVGATYKAAIRFVSWSQNPNPRVSDSYWHPFISRPEPFARPYEKPFFPEIGQGVSLLQYGLKRRLDGSTQSIAEMLTPTPALCMAKRSPRHPSDESLSEVWAYHIDAHRFADFLEEKTKERGVRHIVDDVVDADCNENGSLRSVRTSGGLRLEADLFLDCTGFRGMLINRTLEEPFISDGNKLLCDSAVAIPCESDPARDGLEPFTTATALDHGWTWNIPLLHRTGCGYVYSRQFTSPGKAEEELRAHLGHRAGDTSPLHLRMRVGYTQNAWVKNCIAIGLSASFIEPLESTGIFLTEHALAALISLFPDRRFDAATTRKYNAMVRDMYEEARDFVMLHYLVSRRDDTEFWKASREAIDIPDTLGEKLAFFQTRLPTLDVLKVTIFRDFNYTCILDGNHKLPPTPHPLLRHIGDSAGERALTTIQQRTNSLLEHLPTHYDYLTQMANSPDSIQPRATKNGLA